MTATDLADMADDDMADDADGFDSMSLGEQVLELHAQIQQLQFDIKALAENIGEIRSRL